MSWQVILKGGSLDKPARLIIRFLFGFVSDSVKVRWLCEKSCNGVTTQDLLSELKLSKIMMIVMMRTMMIMMMMI